MRILILLMLLALVSLVMGWNRGCGDVCDGCSRDKSHECPGCLICRVRASANR